MRKQIEKFVCNLGRIDRIDALAGDASTRQYFRVTISGHSFVVCHDPEYLCVERDNYPLLIVNRLFKNYNIRIPVIHKIDSQAGMLLLEDVGDLSLEIAANQLDSDQLETTYSGLIEIMTDIQEIPRSTDLPFNRCFDSQKLMFEFNFFIEHALIGYAGIQMNESRLANLRDSFNQIAEKLNRPEWFVLNHRDFHSRNIFMTVGGPVLIDYQDAALGLPQYDAVSLLRDSYHILDEALFQKLLIIHYNFLRTRRLVDFSFDEYYHYFDLMAFQRNIKALGTFGFLVTVRGQNTYHKYIRPTASYLSSYAERRPELQTVSEILIPFIEVTI